MNLEEQPCADWTVKLHMHFVVICFDMKTSAENININMSPFALCSYLLIIMQLLPHVTYHLFQSQLSSSHLISTHSAFLISTHLFSKPLLFLSCVIFLLYSWPHLTGSTVHSWGCVLHGSLQTSRICAPRPHRTSLQPNHSPTKISHTL